MRRLSSEADAAGALLVWVFSTAKTLPEIFEVWLIGSDTHPSVYLPARRTDIVVMRFFWRHAMANRRKLLGLTALALELYVSAKSNESDLPRLDYVLQLPYVKLLDGSIW